MDRSPGTRKNGSNFDDATVEAVWQKGTPESQYPSFRKDAWSINAAFEIPQDGAMGMGN